MKSKRTKACEISPKTKKIVYERDERKVHYMWKASTNIF